MGGYPIGVRRVGGTLHYAEPGAGQREAFDDADDVGLAGRVIDTANLMRNAVRALFLRRAGCARRAGHAGGRKE